MRQGRRGVSNQAPPPRLKLNGKPLDLGDESPSVQRLRRLLLKSPPDELFTTPELQRRTGCCNSTFARLRARYPELAHVHRNHTYWGHPQAILALKRELEKA